MFFSRGCPEKNFVTSKSCFSAYQYHLKDHLGNVRATFKTEIDVDTYLTTLESDSASVEEQYFYNLDSVRVTYASANKTALGDEAARVGQDSLHSVGPAIALSVVPGDTIDMEVWAYYEGGSGYANTIAPETFIAALARAFGGSSGAAGESGTIFEGVNEAINGGAGGLGSNTDTNVPGAYLSYILFDQNYKEIQSGYHEISDAASYAHEKLFLNDITISQAGYLYIYTSMQSKGTQPVYFDDMKVTHTHSPIVSKDDYYPFGLTFASYNRPASTSQNFKYNNFEYQQDLGLNLYDYLARQYDPALGRFTSVDPAADLMRRFSPYNYGFNNPVRFIDPDGMISTDVVENEEENQQDTEQSEQNKPKEEVKKDDNVDFHFMGSPVDFSETHAGQDIDAFLSGDFVSVDKDTNSETSESEIEDGIEETTSDGTGVDNAPKGKGAIVEKGKSAVGVEAPDESSRTSLTLGSILSWVTGFNEVKPTGDSTIVKDAFNNNKGMVVPLLNNGNASYGSNWMKSYRTATKKDSLKYLKK